VSVLGLGRKGVVKEERVVAGNVKDAGGTGNDEEPKREERHPLLVPVVWLGLGSGGGKGKGGTKAATHRPPGNLGN
jgi:hypothetical protein